MSILLTRTRDEKIEHKSRTKIHLKLKGNAVIRTTR